VPIASATISVRPVTLRDRDRLLAWANDPGTRAASFTEERIHPEVHRRWLAQRLADPTGGRIWVGRRGRRLIGIVRVDQSSDGVLVVSIALDRTERGRGYSRPLLEAGLTAARDAYPGVTFRAWIRPGNDASLALFRSAGFVPVPRPGVVPRGAPPDATVVERS
jgi:RimJ/RimL family protein N-acetyltransferase